MTPTPDPTLTLEHVRTLLDAATPGPWEIGTTGNGTPGYVYCDNELGSAVAIAYGAALPFQVFPTSVLEANAALIAAAPTIAAEFVRVATENLDLAAALADARQEVERVRGVVSGVAANTRYYKEDSRSLLRIRMEGIHHECVAALEPGA